MKFTEAKLEEAIIELLGEEGYPHVLGDTIDREPGEVLIKEDLRKFLEQQYAAEDITEAEINSIILRLEALPASVMLAQKGFSNHQRVERRDERAHCQPVNRRRCDQ